MMFIAFLLRPWIILMRKIKAVPRILADDILDYAQGEGHEKKFKDAFDITHSFMKDIGAELAPTKSTTFSTNRKTRQRLRDHNWERSGQKIKVVVHARDLGSHLTTAVTMCAPTLTNRMVEAAQLINRIARTNLTTTMRAHVIRMAGIAKGLYGVECSAENGQALQKLRVAIANAIAPKSSLRSLDLTFATANLGRDLDPLIILMVRRVSMLRRMLAKHDHLQTMVQQTWENYRKNGHQGTFCDPKVMAGKSPMPGFGKGNRNKWKCATEPRGPIGLVFKIPPSNGSQLKF